MKTAINHFIEIIDNCATSDLQPNTLKLLGIIKHTALIMIDIEKKQIKDAVIYGNRQDIYDATENELAEYYYIEKYIKNNL